MSGWPQALFLFQEKISQEFKCSICLHVLNNPRQCPGNRHRFCLGCISRHLGDSNSCPVCKCELSHATLARNKPLKKAIGKMKMKCPTTQGIETGSSDSFCAWIGAVDDHIRHVERDCGFAVVVCAHEGCQTSMQRRLVTAHDECCDYKMVPCDHCGVMAERVAQAEHTLVCLRNANSRSLEDGESFRGTRTQQSATASEFAIIAEEVVSCRSCTSRNPAAALDLAACGSTQQKAMHWLFSFHVKYDEITFHFSCEHAGTGTGSNRRISEEVARWHGIRRGAEGRAHEWPRHHHQTRRSHLRRPVAAGQDAWPRCVQVAGWVCV